VLELAEKIIDLTGSPSRLVFKPLPSDDPKRRRPEISLAKEKLGWEPKVPLEQGLRKTIQYYEEQLRPMSVNAFRATVIRSLQKEVETDQGCISRATYL
jgi:hypothetical protein